MRTILVAASAFLLVVAAVMLVRTAVYGPPELAPARPAAHIVVDRDLVAERLAAALRIRTISTQGAPPDAEAFDSMARLLAKDFPRVHARLAPETVAAHSLLFRWQGTDPALDPVLFSAHMDVVPVDPGTLGAWTYPPFAGRIADGYVWGRGALDMKQSLLAILEAAEALLADGFTPTRTLIFAFTHDEEIESRGARAIADQLAAEGRHLYFTLDEGLMITEGVVPGVSRPVALVGTAQKGYLTLELTAHGAGGHSSMPPAMTPVSRIAAAVAALSANPPPARLQPPTTDMFASLASGMGYANRFALANAWLLRPFILDRLSALPATNAVVRTTVAPTMLSGGIAQNVLPQSASAMVNFRLLPGDLPEGIIAYVERTIEDPRVEVRVAGEASPPSRVSDLWSEAPRPLADAVRQIFPDAILAPALSVASSDTRYYLGIAERSYFFLPTRVTAKDLERIHGVDERISVDSHVEMVRFYAQLMINISAAAEAR